MADDDKPIEIDDKGKPEEEDEPESKAEETPAEPEVAKTEQPPPVGGSKMDRFKHWYKTKKKLSIPLTVVTLLILLSILPFTRYALPGLIYKKDFSVSVIDSETNTPVSGAIVSEGGTSVTTGGDGKAVIKLSVGHHDLSVTKTNYKDSSTNVTVPIIGSGSAPTVSFEATGRQVKVTVTNTITKKPIANVEIKMNDSTAKTDANGSAIVVVSEATKKSQATLSLEGYDSKEVTVLSDQLTFKQDTFTEAEVTPVSEDPSLQNNNFKLTPAGKIYFISKLSGKIDVVKSNLDGTARKTVLAGTGKESENNTVLLAAKDWKYLALLSRRDSDQAKLYLFDTTTDKLSVIDEGDADFTPIGWDDHNFLYQVHRNSVKDWKPNQESIKTFNADSKGLATLDSTTASGHNSEDYLKEQYNSALYIIDHNLIYEKSWDWGYNIDTVTSKKDGVYKIGVTGANHSTLYTYSVDKYLQSFLSEPREIYYKQGYDSPRYFVYKNGIFKEDSSIKSDYEKYDETYVESTFLQSPDSQKTFWSEQRDGKNTLLVGDVDGNNEKSVGRSEDYVPYGWFSNDYLLVSKSASELYIFSKDGLPEDGKAIKITDYHKPAHNFYFYGGGYGGI